jgi:DNA-binding NtrC family response regulator
MKASVLILCECDGNQCRDLEKHLITSEISVTVAKDQKTSLKRFRKQKPDLVVVCAHTLDATGDIETISQIRRLNSRTPIILITKHSSESLAIAALKAGANDYFRENANIYKIAAAILERLPEPVRASRQKSQNLSVCIKSKPVMIGASLPMKNVYSNILKVARTDSTVLVTGETGTGKDLATRAIHINSDRRKKPLVCVNCAAIPDSLVESELFGYERGAFTGAFAAKSGLFEAADSGIIFLDEIGDMTPIAQAKILRTIEMKKSHRIGSKSPKSLDFRVIAATNQDPEKLVSEKKFRKDLYYRLNVARVHMPPLRDRKEDIPSLIDHYVSHFNQTFGRNVIGFKQSAIRHMLCYHWPGNVRELKNIVEVSFINLPAREVDYIDLPEKFRSKIRTTKSLPEHEREKVIAALRATKWKKSKAARQLKWSRMTLYRKMEKYNIDKRPQQ